MLEYMFLILHSQFEQLTIQNKRDEHVNSVLNKIRRYINAFFEISLRVRIFRFCPNFIFFK